MSIGMSLFLLICHNIRKSPVAMARLTKVVTMTKRTDSPIPGNAVAPTPSRRSVSFARDPANGAKAENGAKDGKGAARGSWFSGNSIMPEDSVEIIRLPPKLSTGEPGASTEVTPPDQLGRTDSVVSDDENLS